MPQREPEVLRSLSSNSAAISELEMRVEQLITRLRPVTRAHDELSPENKCATESTIPMVEMLDTQRRRLDRIIEAVDQAIEMLEI
jgi:hypothetical protein